MSACPSTLCHSSSSLPDPLRFSMRHHKNQSAGSLDCCHHPLWAVTTHCELSRHYICWCIKIARSRLPFRWVTSWRQIIGFSPGVEPKASALLSLSCTCNNALYVSYLWFASYVNCVNETHHVLTCKRAQSLQCSSLGWSPDCVGTVLTLYMARLSLTDYTAQERAI